jgi:hypothetical protein
MKTQECVTTRAAILLVEGHHMHTESALKDIQFSAHQSLVFLCSFIRPLARRNTQLINGHQLWGSIGSTATDDVAVDKSSRLPKPLSRMTHGSRCEIRPTKNCIEQRSSCQFFQLLAVASCKLGAF